MRDSERVAAYRRIIAIIIAILGLVLSFMIVRPFIVSIISAAILAYLFYPAYKYFLSYVPKNLRPESIAALLTCLIMVLIIFIPLVGITVVLSGEVADGYNFFQNILRSPSFTFELPPLVRHYLGDISQFKEPFANLGTQLILWVEKIITSIPNAVMNIFLTVFSVYFFLKGGQNVMSFIEDFFPLPEGRYKQIFTRFDELSKGMILGQIVVGIIQGILAGLAFFVLGVPNPVLWGVLTAIISTIPMLGAALVWLPVVAYLFMVESLTGNYARTWSLLIFGTFVISTIDNILKPKIIGERARIHPLIILFGIVGGIQLLGIPGLLIGPMILTVFDVTLEILRDVI